MEIVTFGGEAMTKDKVEVFKVAITVFVAVTHGYHSTNSTNGHSMRFGDLSRNSDWYRCSADEICCQVLIC